MSSPFVAEIRIFPFNFAPRGWAFCAGQILPISQNTALFSLLGTMYGGDGKSNFALPNLQGNTAMHTTQYSGNSPFGQFSLGETGGEDNVTLLQSEMPAHTHNLMASALPANKTAPDSNAALARSAPGQAYSDQTTLSVTLSPQAIAPTGNGQPHNNMMPYLTLNYCIALQGILSTAVLIPGKGRRPPGNSQN